MHINLFKIFEATDYYSYSKIFFRDRDILSIWLAVILIKYGTHLF